MAVIKNNKILKYLLMMVVSLFLILNFSIGVLASINYDRQEADACITISERFSVKGGNANAEGRYLFETFSPLTNRENLALPYEWNSMTGIQQFQVKNGTTIITGKAAPQTGFGAQYTGGANQWYINNLEDLIKCH